jgi:adenine-specific DNA-methyltransferase
MDELYYYIANDSYISINDIYNKINELEIRLGSSNNENILGSIHEKQMQSDNKKSYGVYYTPKFIVDYILEKTIKNEDILKNPYIKIFDISCGCGNFLLEVYDILYKKFEENIEILRENYKDEIYKIKLMGNEISLIGYNYWTKENIHYHILKHCIYGADIDKNAVNMLIASFILKNPYVYTEDINIVCCDSLIKHEKKESEYKEFWSNKFDYIVGNPPYIGHKKLDINYKKWLLEEYTEVYKDKSDIYYCFYKRILDTLKEKGISSIITPRYFIESPSGKYLRNYLKENSKIKEIVDFYGCDIFKNIGIASSIITFEKSTPNDNNISIYKLKDEIVDLTNNNLSDMLKENVFEHFTLNQRSLDDRWLLIPKYKLNIYINIINNTSYKLSDICESFQGIITGCDKAFVLSYDDVYKYNIEEDLLKKWIKNKNIEKYFINESKYNLIYSDDIDNENNYSNSINYINNYKLKLLNRRECKSGTRNWYQLQWGRSKEEFEKEKIMFPYKSSFNKFAIDKENRYCSADVYSFYIKDEYKEKFSHEYIIGILNSKVYDYYFKLFAKKMSKCIYDYYPNTVMELKIFKNEDYNTIDLLSKEIIKISSKNILCDEDIRNIQRIEEDINNLIIKALHIDEF